MHCNITKASTHKSWPTQLKQTLGCGTIASCKQCCAIQCSFRLAAFMLCTALVYFLIICRILFNKILSSINSTDINDRSCVGATPVATALAPDSTEDTCRAVALPLPPDKPTGEHSPHSSSSCASFESLLSEVDDHELSKTFTDCSRNI